MKLVASKQKPVGMTIEELEPGDFVTVVQDTVGRGWSGDLALITSIPDTNGGEELALVSLSDESCSVTSDFEGLTFARVAIGTTFTLKE